MPPGLSPMLGFAPFGQLLLAATPALQQGPADVWGLISQPAQPPPPGESKGDPALWIYLQFLQAWLQTDHEATALWAAVGMAPNAPVVKAIYAHSPTDEAELYGLGLSNTTLPALFMWVKGGGDSSSVEWQAEEWAVKTKDVRLLWVFPDTVQQFQRSRESFCNAMGDAIFVAIERGRTPSFKVAGDPDPLAATRGSYVHLFTAVMAMTAVKWGPAKVRINSVGPKGEGQASVIEKNALEVRFEMLENLVRDPNIWSYPNRQLIQSVSVPLGFSAWGLRTLYAAEAVIAVGVGGAPYLYQCGGTGLSGFSTPRWPTNEGGTVTDGQLVWTCLGAAPPEYTVTGQS